MDTSQVYLNEKIGACFDHEIHATSRLKYSVALIFSAMQSKSKVIPAFMKNCVFT